MKDFKIIQIEASVPSYTRPSEYNMPSRIIDLQKDGYVVDRVTVSDPVLVSTTTNIRDAWQKAENSYVVFITYMLSKEIPQKKGIYD